MKRGGGGGRGIPHSLTNPDNIQGGCKRIHTFYCGATMETSLEYESICFNLF